MSQAVDQQLMLEVATPTGKALSLTAVSVQVPGIQGELGVLPRHLPLLTALRPGILRYVVDGRTRVAAVGTGYVEVGPGRVRVLTDRFATPEGMQPDTVEREFGEAASRLAAFKGLITSQSYQELAEDVAWSQARLDVLKSRAD